MKQIWQQVDTVAIAVGDCDTVHSLPSSFLSDNPRTPHLPLCVCLSVSVCVCGRARVCWDFFSILI